MAPSDDRGRRAGRGARDGTESAARERARRIRARRVAVRRRRAVALLVLAAALAVGLAAFGGSAAPPRAAARPPAASARRPAVAAARSTTAAAASRARAVRTAPRASEPSPGSLPQTRAYPSAASPVFRGLMAALWSGVVHDSLTHALPAFFPEKAYLQLKAISYAASDWSGRLVHDYGLDLAAAHRLLGREARHARLVSVNVISSYGHWIPPGVCYNRIGYYEMPNTRVVYRVGGQVRSFGIASMISWRGVWYVVHFGAILRATDTGMVDDPVNGPGISAYSGTC